MNNLVPQSVLSQYDIGDIQAISIVPSGLVHRTFHIRSDKGQYIIQRLHPILASDGVADDFFAVTSFLKEQGFLAPECVLTKDGHVLAINEKGKWRMQTCVSGRSFGVVQNGHIANEAGRIFGEFHKTLNLIPYEFKSDLILHQTQKEYERFLAAFPQELPVETQEEVKFVRDALPKFFLPDTLPLRVIHGDPKISNIIFDECGKAVSIIDLDTCNRSSVLVELGDAFRSWCGGKEDDPDNKFDVEIFSQAWSGYKEVAGDMLTREELQWLPTAIGTITLELTARFLADYFNDSYFGWDPDRYDSRCTHNLARARGQIAEFQSIQGSIIDIENIIRQ